MPKSLVEQQDLMEKVIAQLIKGDSETAIAKQLGIKRTEVISLIEQWKILAFEDSDIKERAREMLLQIDEHYKFVIKAAWEIHKEAEKHSDKISALKLIADTEKVRQAMFQQAALTGDDELAQRLAETEERQEVLQGILREVTASCSHCKIEVRRRLSKISGEAEVIPMESEAG